MHISYPRSHGRITRFALAAMTVTALTLTVSVGTVLGWARPSLASNCAADSTHFSWVITLTQEPDYKIQFSWSSNFSNPWTSDLGHAGSHAFATDRGGSTLYARWKNDTSKSTSAVANQQLCVQPTPTPILIATPTPTPIPTPTPMPTSTPTTPQVVQSAAPTPTPTPRAAVLAGNPITVLPDTAVPAELSPQLALPLGVLVLSLVAVGRGQMARRRR